jgi:hypothetical protein
MSCTSNTPNINKTFIIEPLSITGGNPTLSACTTMFTNLVKSCSGDTTITMSSGVVTFNSNVDGINSLTANTIEATTYLSGGTNILDIVNGNDTFITGGTFSDVTDTISLLRNDGAQVLITGLTNTFTTGGTYNNNTGLITFNTNSQLGAYTVDLSSIDLNDTYVTGSTLYNGILTIRRNDNESIVVTGFSETFTGNTSGNCISDLYVSNIHSCSPLLINPNDEGDVAFGSTSGVTIQVLSGQVTANYFSGDGSKLINIPISGVTNLQSELDSKTNQISFTAHTGDTDNPHLTAFSSLTTTAHTHTLNEITDFDAYSASTNVKIDTKISFVDAQTNYVNVSGDTMSGSLTINDNLTVTGNTILSGLTIVYGDSPTSAAIRPGFDDTYDLGTPSFRWREVFSTNVDITNSLSTEYLNVNAFSYFYDDVSITGNTIVDGIISTNTIYLTQIPSINNSGTEVLIRNTDSGEIEYRNVPTLIGYESTATTVDDTVTKVSTISGITSDASRFVEVFVTAHNNTNNYGFWKRTLMVNNVSGNSNIILENADIDSQSSGLTPVNVFFSGSGSDIFVLVSGETSTTYNWLINWEIIKR